MPLQLEGGASWRACSRSDGLLIQSPHESLNSCGTSQEENPPA